MTNNNEDSFLISITNIRKLKVFLNNIGTLCRVRHLGDVLPNQPKSIYRRAPNFGDQVARNILDPPGQQTMKIYLKGFYSCRKCIYVVEQLMLATEA